MGLEIEVELGSVKEKHHPDVWSRTFLAWRGKLEPNNASNDETKADQTSRGGRLTQQNDTQDRRAYCADSDPNRVRRADR